MNTAKSVACVVITMSLLGLGGLIGCQSEKHTMVEAKPGEVVVCSKCYDQIRKARSTGGPRGGLATNRTITTHMCEECKTEMSIYSETGVLMIKCAKCAPEGVPCDKWRQPGSYNAPTR